MSGYLSPGATRGAVLALGTFDGVHRGHVALIHAAARDARSRELPLVAVTFDPDPDDIVHPQSLTPHLLTLPERIACLREAGADHVEVIPFTREVANLAPSDFVTRILLTEFRIHAIHVGYDFRFGARAAGDQDVLADLGATSGFTVVPHDLLQSVGQPITATRIRHAIADGDVAVAADLLGRPHRVAGRVMHGRGQGVEIGFATANVHPRERSALPRDGVYAGRVSVGADSFVAGISVGVPPTFPEAHDVLEAHLLDTTIDLYDAHVVVEFVVRLRDQRAFSSVAELHDAIDADIAAIREMVPR